MDKNDKASDSCFEMQTSRHRLQKTEGSLLVDSQNATEKAVLRMIFL